jgi:arylsulfatase A-like enzyme
MYSFQLCSPSRSALQTGRNPIHVNVLNMPIGAWNKGDPIGGFAGAPPAMLGLADWLCNSSSSTYACHMAGKWDVGMGLAAQTPHGHSYNSSLLYFSHCVDYWTATPSNGCPPHTNPRSDQLVAVVDLWEDDGPSTRNGSSSCGGAAQPVTHCDCSGCDNCIDPNDMVHGKRLVLGPFAGGDNDARYIDELFTERVLAVISDAGCGNERSQRMMNGVGDDLAGRHSGGASSNNMSSSSDNATKVPTPVFIFWAPHAAHTPLQVPAKWLAHVDQVTAAAAAPPIDRSERRAYLGLISSVDADFGRVVSALRAEGMYDNTLIVLVSDNGG